MLSKVSSNSSRTSVSKSFLPSPEVIEEIKLEIKRLS